MIFENVRPVRIGLSLGAVVVGALGSLQPRVHIRGRGMRNAEELEQEGTLDR